MSAHLTAPAMGRRIRQEIPFIFNGLEHATAARIVPLVLVKEELMSRWGVSHILILVLAVGGLFEVIKRLPRPDFKLAGNPSRVEQSKPYSRENLREARAQAPPRNSVQAQKAVKARSSGNLVIPPLEGKFDAHAPQAAATNKTNQAKAIPTKDKATKKCRPKGEGESQATQLLDPSHPDLKLATQPIPMEEITKAENAKSKGDQSEDEEECNEEQQEVAKEDPKLSEDDKSDQELDDLNAFEPAPTLGGGLVINNNQATDIPGLEEWKKRLLDQPNFKETVRLIEAVQKGEISTALFHAVVKLMLEDNRQQIRELGVLAAGRVPSYESFHLLVSVLKVETFGSKIRTRAENELAFYQQLPYLTVVENVLRNSEDVFALVWATRTLEDSAKHYLQTKYNRKGSSGSSTNPYLSTYNRFVSVLEELIREGQDSQQVAQARQTLSSLQDLIRALS